MFKKIVSFIVFAATLALGSTMMRPSEVQAKPNIRAPTGVGSKVSAYGSIVTGNSGKCLNVPSGSTDDNRTINQLQCDNSIEQNFVLKMSGNGYYSIATEYGKKCLEELYGSTDDNRAIYQKCNNMSEQSFALMEVGNGYYKIMAQNSGKCINVPDGSMDDSIGITMVQCNDTPGQRFLFPALSIVGAEQQMQKPLPSLVALHIQQVYVIAVSGGIQFSKSNLFGRGGDNLFIKLDGIAQWPAAHTGANSIYASVGSYIDVRMSWNVPTNIPRTFQLWDRDTGPDDFLGGFIVKAENLKPGYSEKFVVHNDSEGSMYEVDVFVTERLASERNGYVNASYWMDRRAYCFPVFGCK